VVNIYKRNVGIDGIEIDVTDIGWKGVEWN
jgi:hypothetical protein